jgi:hypothetical protein
LSERSKLAITILATAVALGLLGDALLRSVPWGLNVGLWVACLGTALAVVTRLRRIPLVGDGRWMILPGIAFALGFAWRDSVALALSNLMALSVCLTLVASSSRSGQIRVAWLGTYVMAALRMAAHASVDFFLLCDKDVEWGKLPRGRWTRRLAAIGRGLAIAAPLVLVFGGLLASADAVFSGIVSNLFRWDLAAFYQNLFWTAFCSWIVGGVARWTLRDSTETEPLVKGPASHSLGIVEIATTLGLLDAIFLTFVVVQVRYLFGGAALVEASVSMTYSEYARRGFFELVSVAALALPVLLAADWLLRRENPAHVRLFRVLAGALVVMLFVVMVSALQRMRLYQDEFGLTELRLYTTAFMAWLALVFAWFLATVLPGRRERFAFGAMIAGFLIVCFLDLLNPDGFIVSTNVDRARSGKSFDAEYVDSLSAGAVPDLVQSLPAIPEQDRRIVARQIVERWSRPPSQDLRSWNWDRDAAWQAVRGYEETLRNAAE